MKWIGGFVVIYIFLDITGLPQVYYSAKYAYSVRADENLYRICMDLRQGGGMNFFGINLASNFGLLDRMVEGELFKEHAKSSLVHIAEECARGNIER
jgi:hypothetical protein